MSLTSLCYPVLICPFMCFSVWAICVNVFFLFPCVNQGLQCANWRIQGETLKDLFCFIFCLRHALEVLLQVQKDNKVTLYFKVSLLQCNYTFKWWVKLINYMYLLLTIWLGLGLAIGLGLLVSDLCPHVLCRTSWFCGVRCVPGVTYIVDPGTTF